MAQTYFPFDSGNGANITESGWGQMAQLWLNTGVIKGQLNQLNAYADSSGMQVKVDTGIAWIQGFYYKNDALVTLPITTAPASNSRIDRVILRVDWSANTIALAILTGTVAASPTPPALTQNSAKWEISLAQVAVGTNVSTIAAGNITDERGFTQAPNAVQGPKSGLTTLNGWVSYNLSIYETTAWKDTLGVVHFNGGRIKNGTTTNGTAIVNIPVGMRPGKHIVWMSGSIQFELDGSTGDITGWGLNGTDTTVGNLSWKAEQ